MRMNALLRPEESPTSMLLRRAFAFDNEGFDFVMPRFEEGAAGHHLKSGPVAKNVLEYLISQGVKPDLISAKGFGEADPVATNDTAKGRTQSCVVHALRAFDSCDLLATGQWPPGCLPPNADVNPRPDVNRLNEFIRSVVERRLT
jgi:hypothetical protein